MSRSQPKKTAQFPLAGPQGTGAAKISLGTELALLGAALTDHSGSVVWVANCLVFIIFFSNASLSSVVVLEPLDGEVRSVKLLIWAVRFLFLNSPYNGPEIVGSYLGTGDRVLAFSPPIVRAVPAGYAARLCVRRKL